MCAHPSRPKRDRRQPPRPIRSAKLRKPAGIIPHTRGRPRAGTVAEHHSAHTETHEDAGTVAEHHLGRARDPSPTHRAAGELWVPVAGRLSAGTSAGVHPCETSHARAASVTTASPTSTTHERKRVCRWEARVYPSWTKGRSSTRRAQREDEVAARGATASAGRRTELTQQRNRMIERPPARWCGREHDAQPKRK